MKRELALWALAIIMVILVPLPIIFGAVGLMIIIRLAQIAFGSDD